MPRKPRCDGDRHVHGERHGHALEQEREAGAGARPRHGDEAHAALGAGDARGARGQERLMLEEVEVPPGLLDGVVHGASGGLALRAVEAGAGLEVELDVEALVGGVEVGRGDEPRRGDAEGELKEVIVAHAAPWGWVDPGSQCAAVPCGHQGQALRVALKRAILDGRPSRRRTAPPSGSSRTPTAQQARFHPLTSPRRRKTGAISTTVRAY